MLAHVNDLRDIGHGMVRTEVRSFHGDSHLGHVFPGGPPDRGRVQAQDATALRPRSGMQLHGNGRK